MRVISGEELPIGVSITNNIINFSIAVCENADCKLLLYKKGNKSPLKTIDMENTAGNIYCIRISNINPYEYEYNYFIDGKVCLDPYAKAIIGREKWKSKSELQKHEVRGSLLNEDFDWEDDRCLKIPVENIISYSLHVRGFTMHSSSGVTKRGTFEGLIEKLIYIHDLGINQIHLMPIYDFEENLSYTNYWGYGEGSYFVPKPSYSAIGNGVTSFKKLVKSFHEKGIEVIIEMPFHEGVSFVMIMDCLRYYVLEYHVDGFILNHTMVSISEVKADPILASSKILYHNEEFKNTMRQFLKGDAGMVPDVMRELYYDSNEVGVYNYITNHNGFTLMDLVSYNYKHNENNGENNTDGPDYNFSWNCGFEGASRKKAVVRLRKNQIRNAFLLLLLSKGAPCILAGDEFGNTQKGNNNVYCQDNATAWLNWNMQDKNRELVDFVRDTIGFRKSAKFFGKSDRGSEITFHGSGANIPTSQDAGRMFAVCYTDVSDNKDYYIAYNMYWEACELALPKAIKGRKWYEMAETNTGFSDKPKLLNSKTKIEVKGRSIKILMRR